MSTRFELVEREGGVGEWRHRENGLRVLTAPTPVAPVVGFGVVYRVGSRHELPGHTGATHILEHLMFKGTERFNRERGTEIALQLHRVGALFNATTWLDRTSYFEVLPVEHLPLAVVLPESTEEVQEIVRICGRDLHAGAGDVAAGDQRELGRIDPAVRLAGVRFDPAIRHHPRIRGHRGVGAHDTPVLVVITMRGRLIDKAVAVVIY